jgi:serine/threonine-protein kinase
MNGAGRYTLGTVLGAGGAGVVYEGWDTELLRRVAIKRLPLTGRDDTWQREARVGARLNHPAFVAVHDTWRDTHHAHLVMERVEGQTLKDLLVAGPVPVTRACGWAAQAADALHSAHHQGVVHGDIKPSNLMIEPNGRIRVLDVGAAQLMDPLATLNQGEAGGGTGTLDYMAPEQLRGEPASVATDLYALGLVLYESLHGHRAFGSLTGLALAYQKLHGAAPTQPVAAHVPVWLARLLRALLAHHPAQRPADMQVVVAMLRGNGVPPLRDDLTPRSGAHAPRDEHVARASDARPGAHSQQATAPRRVWQLTGVAVLLAAVVAGAWLGWPATSPAPPPTAWVAEQLGAAETALRNYDEPGVLDDASRRLMGLLERAPQHPAGAALLAMTRCLQYTQGPANEAMLHEAGRWAQLALSTDGHLALSHVARGMHAMLSGDRPAAEVAYREALLLDPRSWQALLWLADLLVTSQRAAEAQPLLDTALKIYPNERLFHDVLGTLQHSQGNYAAAETAFRRSLALKPTGSLAYTNLSDALARQGRPEEALAVLQQGLLLRPHHRLYMHLGNALYGRGRFAEAAAAYERGLATLPAGQADAWLLANLGDALSRLPGRAPQARVSYQRALTGAEALARRYPANPTFASRAGLYAARLNNPDAALHWTAAALALAPESPDVLFRAAVSSALLGQAAEARTRLTHALALGYPAALAANEPALASLAPVAAASAAKFPSPH